jgi:hypothetical protein
MNWKMIKKYWHVPITKISYFDWDIYYDVVTIKIFGITIFKWLKK